MSESPDRARRAVVCRARKNDEREAAWPARMLAAAFSLFALVCLRPGVVAGHGGTPEPDTAPLIAELRAKVARKPRLYPAQAELAHACLRQAKATLDPAMVDCARKAALASLDVQLTVEAFTALAGTEAFSHRFQACVDAASKAESGRPGDGAMLSLRVDCLLALGRVPEARALVDASRAGAGGDHPSTSLAFYVPVADASLAKADGNVDAAVEAYRRAAAEAERVTKTFAADANRPATSAATAPPIPGSAAVSATAPAAQPSSSATAHAAHGSATALPQKLPVDHAVELRIWALVAASSVLAEAGRIAEAAELLGLARGSESPNLLIQIHQAQLMAATGNADFAFNAFRGLASQGVGQGVGYEAWLGAWRQARLIGKTEDEARYWDLLERTLRAPIDAGEFYTLDMLASLYLEADVKSAEALDLAQRNATTRNDETARRLLAKAEARAAKASAESP